MSLTTNVTEGNQQRPSSVRKKCPWLTLKTQDAQLSQRDRKAVCISFGQKWKTGTERQYFYFTDIIVLSSTTVT